MSYPISDLSAGGRQGCTRDSSSPKSRVGFQITRHGKPAGVLIGFESEGDWFDYRLEHDERFLRKVSEARVDNAAGRGVRLEDL